MLLADLTTIRVGGPARDFVRGETADSIADAALAAWSDGDDVLVVGGGSNLLVADDGVDATVIHAVSSGIERLDSHDGVVLRIQAGESWDGIVARTVAEGFVGIEALSGIPGSVGAAPIQNIGAYGQELASTLVAVDFLDGITGTRSRLEAAELELGYRTSTLKQGRPGIVLAVELALAPGNTTVAGYDQLAGALGVAVGDAVPLAAVRERVLALRAAKGMLLDPADPDSVSCGSFFTNPIVTENFARGLPTDAPRWLEDDDIHVKLSAAWLIERSGIRRGFALPGSRAGISSKHTLAIVNRGGASAEEIGELARYVRTRVLSQFGVLLAPEPVAVGVSL
jgi:UDP-N-acetylmuramate dehydrogenase